MQEIADTRDLSAKPAQNRKRPRLIRETAVVLFIIDRILKQIALSGLVAGGGVFSFELFRNSGIAFSIPLPNAAFWPVAVLVYALLIWLYVVTRLRQPIMASLLILILAGATSNVLDRIVHGATIDYLILFSRSAVNLADGMILGGILALFIHSRSAAQRT